VTLQGPACGRGSKGEAVFEVCNCYGYAGFEGLGHLIGLYGTKHKNLGLRQFPAERDGFVDVRNCKRLYPKGSGMRGNILEAMPVCVGFDNKDDLDGTTEGLLHGTYVAAEYG
jgi:hypothetical protein